MPIRSLTDILDEIHEIIPEEHPVCDQLQEIYENKAGRTDLEMRQLASTFISQLKDEGGMGVPGWVEAVKTIWIRGNDPDME